VDGAAVALGGASFTTANGTATVCGGKLESCMGVAIGKKAPFLQTALV
jgi:hypothetical protein